MQELRMDAQTAHIGVTCVHPGIVVTNIFKSAREGPKTAEGYSNKETQKGLEMLGSHTAQSAAEMIVGGVEQGNTRILITPEAHVLDLAIRMFPRQFYSESLAAKLLLKFPLVILCLLGNVGARVVPVYKLHSLQWVGADHILAASLAAGAYCMKSNL